MEGVVLNKIEVFLNNINNNISDIHIREEENIIVRINGRIEYSDTYTTRKEIIDFLKLHRILNNSKEEYKYYGFEQFFSENDIAIDNQKNRFRGNIFLYSCGKLGIVFRKIDKYIKSIEELGIPDILKKICNLNSGLFIITGPTGSGKTSTQAAIIKYINENYQKHIITIEDPIEYVFRNEKSIITQREIGKDSESFGCALKYSLRQDPDVIVIGEIRDNETLKAAMNAAETGRLCICTMHTLGVAATIDRIIDIFESDEKEKYRFQLSMVLECIYSQQLISVKQDLSSIKRVVVSEVLIADKSSRNMIREGKNNQIANYLITNKEKGMISMDDELVKLYNRNIIEYEQLIFHCIDREYIDKKVSKNKKVCFFD